MMPSRIIIFKRRLSFMICILGEAYNVELVRVDRLHVYGRVKEVEREKKVGEKIQRLCFPCFRGIHRRSLCFLIKFSTNRVLGLELHGMIGRVHSRSKLVVFRLLMFPMVDGDVFSLFTSNEFQSKGNHTTVANSQDLSSRNQEICC